jgi:hypothetical protein
MAFIALLILVIFVQATMIIDQEVRTKDLISKMDGLIKQTNITLDMVASSSCFQQLTATTSNENIYDYGN